MTSVKFALTFESAIVTDTLHQLTLTDVLDEHCRSLPGRTAAVFEGRRFTFQELANRVDQLAAALKSERVGPGDRVLWLGQNTHAVLEGILACAKLGAMCCPVNWRQSPAELAFVIDDLSPKIVLWQDVEIGDVIAAARTEATHSAGRWIAFDGEGTDSYEAFLANAPRFEAGVEQDVTAACLIIYTAAFQGRPNGAMLSQAAIMAQNLNLITVQDLTSRTVFLNSGPLFHIGTLMLTLATFHVGGTNLFIRRTDARTIAQTVHDERATLAFLVWKTQEEIADLNLDSRYDLTCLKSPPAMEAWNRMVSVTSLRSLLGFGQTEVSGPVIWSYYGLGETESRFGRTGPVAQVRILNEDGSEASPGETGEIAVRGPTVCNGYWNRPEINCARIRDGWWLCNDLGRREADGSITFVGPKTLMIKSGVENIYPAEVEGCLRMHPAVAEAAVIGVPDPTWVQSVKAILVLKPGCAASSTEIIEFCRERIASYKKPKSVEFVDHLPKVPPGFTDYKALDLAFGGGGYPGGETRSN